MSQEGILKYPPPLLLRLEGPEICLYIPIEILTEKTLYLSFQLLVAFSSENAIPVILVEF